MASSNSSLIIADPDFNSIKQALKTYLKGQDKFSDYDFEGSNMSVLLDILSYNTHMNAFYLNMIGSEMFLDSSQMAESIISHAKEIGYLPRSSISSSATVDIKITPSDNPGVIVIPPKYPLSSRVSSNTYEFYTSDAITVVPNSTGEYIAKNVEIKEGLYLSEYYTLSSNTDQKLIISNQQIDTSSLEIYVNEGDGEFAYTLANTLLGVSGSSNVCFIEPNNLNYALYFGDDILGNRPSVGSTVRLTYRISNGTPPNGCKVFSPVSSIQGYSNVTVTTISNAAGGSNRESLESIKFYAPKMFKTQQRAVTTSDYKLILQQNFPEIQGIAVFGGEELDPPQYGKVIISIDTSDGDGISQSRKDNYSKFLQDKTPLSISLSFIDPDFMYMKINSIVKYDYTKTTLSVNDIKTLVSAKIAEYNELYTTGFDKTFRYSKFIENINDSHSSILSNDTDILLFKLYSPNTSLPVSKTLEYNNKLQKTTSVDRFGNPLQTSKSVFSTYFTFEGKNCRFEDSDGVLNIITSLDSGDSIVKPACGTVDYDTGKIIINAIAFDVEPSAAIKIYVRTDSKDISVTKNSYLTIDESVSNISVEADSE